MIYPKCSDCLWCLKGEVNPETLESKLQCRRNPPTISLVPTPQGPAHMSVFPTVTDEFWCGEFEDKAQQDATRQLIEGLATVGGEPS